MAMQSLPGPTTASSMQLQETTYQKSGIAQKCSKVTGVIDPSSVSIGPAKRKISYIDEPEDEAMAFASRHYHLESNLEDLGMTGHGRNSMLREVLGDAFALSATRSDRVGSQQVDAFPARPYMDILIHNFLDNINFVYCIVHSESLLQEYDSWWQTRRLHPDIELEGLLFRLMAISAQFLPDQLSDNLESALGEDTITLKFQWHRSAEARHAKIRPGKGGLRHVQQLFLNASFYKTEAMYVDSWHALSAAIRIAQELNMHRDSSSCNVSAFEREVRRQVWCSLYTWDRLTAFLFDRPPMIHRGRTILIEPITSLHQDPLRPDSPSPILSRIYEFRLAKALDQYLDQDPQHADFKQVTLAIRDVKDWLQSLPSLLSIRNGDTNWDSQCPRINYSRLGLHLTAYSCLFCISRTCLTNSTFPEGSSPAERDRLRSACMEYCIRMTDVFDRLTRSDTHAHFLIAFCLFETSATVCTAMIKDEFRALPKRDAVLQALGQAKSILNRLSRTTIVAASSAKVLNQLIHRLKLEQPDTCDSISKGETVELVMDHDVPVEDVATQLPGGIRSVAQGDSNHSKGSQGTDISATEARLSCTDWSGLDSFLIGDFYQSSDIINTDVDLLPVDQVWDW